jgi:hypothetical protein
MLLASHFPDEDPNQPQATGQADENEVEEEVDQAIMLSRHYISFHLVWRVLTKGHVFCAKKT